MSSRAEMGSLSRPLNTPQYLQFSWRALFRLESQRFVNDALFTPTSAVCREHHDRSIRAGALSAHDYVTLRLQMMFERVTDDRQSCIM